MLNINLSTGPSKVMVHKGCGTAKRIMKQTKTTGCRELSVRILARTRILSGSLRGGGKQSLASSLDRLARSLSDQVLEGDIYDHSEEDAALLVKTIGSAFELETQLHTVIRLEPDHARQAVEILVLLDRALESLVLQLEDLLEDPEQ